MKRCKESNEDDLLSLLYAWYGKCYWKNGEHNDYIKQWKNMWFAKNAEQKEIDLFLKTTYGESVKKYEKYVPVCLHEKIALIILFDQVTRNIYRETKYAYAYDDISLSLTKNIISNNEHLRMPFHMLITLFLCLIHSENVEDHVIAKKMLNKMKIDYSKYYELISAMDTIYENHNSRIEMFGRIPERNKFLNRKSTTAEIVFMNEIQ